MLSYISSLFIPIFLLVLIVVAMFKKLPIFSLFVEGAKEGIHTCGEILPTLVGLIVAIEMLKASGFLDIVCNIISPVTTFFHLPSELVPLALLRPLSGSGATAMLSTILKTNGADSFLSKMACILTGSTETTFYTISVYFSAIDIKKTGCTLPFALFADFMGLVATIICASIFL